MIWDDGRSGAAGCIAGDLALRRLAESVGSIRKVKGTVFEGPTTFLIGRVCSSDSYLSEPLVHWANASWDQHRQLQADARAVGKSLHYLFVTATVDPAAAVRYWKVPADVVANVFAARGKDRPGATCAIHIVANQDRQLLGRTDVTEHQSVVVLGGTDADRLAKAFYEAGPGGAARPHAAAATPSPVSARHRSSARASATAFPSATYDIPVSGGRSVTLEIPGPLSDADVLRVKSWLDVTTDVLTEGFDADRIAEQRRWLRDQVDAGLAQLERGEKVDGETAFDRVLASRRAAGRNAAK